MENESYYYDYPLNGSDEVKSDYKEDDPGTVLFKFVVDGLLLLAVCAFGLLGNIFTLFVLSRPQMKSTVSYYLQHLAVYDMLFLICKLFLDVMYEHTHPNTVMWKIYTALYPGFLYFISVFTYMVRMGSIWTTVGVSIERYIAICHPLKSKTFCTYRRTVQANIIIALSVICFNIPRFFVYNIVPEFDESTNTTSKVLEFSDFGKSYGFHTYDTWIDNAVINSVIPFLSLLFLNISIFVTVRKARRARKAMTQKQETDIKISMMLICVVTIFFICYASSFISGIALAVGLDEWYANRLPSMMHFMEAINSSANFIVYSVMGQHFRTGVAQIFCGKRFQRAQAVRK